MQARPNLAEIFRTHPHSEAEENTGDLTLRTDEPVVPRRDFLSAHQLQIGIASTAVTLCTSTLTVTAGSPWAPILWMSSSKNIRSWQGGSHSPHFLPDLHAPQGDHPLFARGQVIRVSKFRHMETINTIWK